MDIQTYYKQQEEQERKERAAWKKISKTILRISPELKLVWKFGDGEGGALFIEMVRLLRDQGFSIPSRLFDAHNGLYISPCTKKAKISRALSKKVFERDGYRCKCCDGHVDLTVDHIHPESKGGTLEIENLQTLCRSCNSKKGAKA